MPRTPGEVGNVGTGEAELCVLNKVAHQISDSNAFWSTRDAFDVWLHTDATTGKATASIKGLGRVGDIADNELWLHQQVLNSKLAIFKIKNKLNVADLVTKYLTREDIEHMIDYLQFGGSRILHVG